MKKILIPVDGSEKSMKAAELSKSVFPPEQAEMFLLFIREDIQYISSEDALLSAKKQTEDILQNVLRRFSGYSCHTETIFGVAGKEIISYARQNDIDIIVVTSKAGMIRKIGSLASYVIGNAPCPVLVLPDEHAAHVFGMLHCEHTEDIVILSGQLGFGHSSCLLPVRAGRCRYEITVLEGSMRFSHLSFNPDGYTWSSPPGQSQPLHYDITAGQKKVIELEALLNYGQLDQIETVNTHLEKQLKFHYKVAFLD